MSPPNFLRFDYFGILKKCRELVAAVELASSWGEEDFTREVQSWCKGLHRLFFLHRPAGQAF